MQGELQCLHGACTGRLQLGRRFDDSMLTALKDYPMVNSFCRGCAGFACSVEPSKNPLWLLHKQGLLHSTHAALWQQVTSYLRQDCCPGSGNNTRGISETAAAAGCSLLIAWLAEMPVAGSLTSTSQHTALTACSPHSCPLHHEMCAFPILGEQICSVMPSMPQQSSIMWLPPPDFTTKRTIPLSRTTGTCHVHEELLLRLMGGSQRLRALMHCTQASAQIPAVLE